MVKMLMAVEAQQRDLRKAGDRRSVLGYLIDRETRSRMEERHGDMLKDGSIEDEALAAVHNDRQGEVLATELRTLARRSGKDGATTPAALARQWAADLRSRRRRGRALLWLVLGPALVGVLYLAVEAGLGMW